VSGKMVVRRYLTIKRHQNVLTMGLGRVGARRSEGHVHHKCYHLAFCTMRDWVKKVVSQRETLCRNRCFEPVPTCTGPLAQLMAALRQG